jgi:hypothetical protein
MVALVALFFFVSALAASSFGQAQEARSEAVDIEHIFGFTEGADIGEKGEKELENTTIGYLGRPGSFTAFTNEATFRYGLEEHFRASFGVLADDDSIHSVPGLTDRTANDLITKQSTCWPRNTANNRSSRPGKRPCGATDHPSRYGQDGRQRIRTVRQQSSSSAPCAAR